MTKEELLSYKNIRRELEDIKKRINQLKSDARSPKGVRFTDTPVCRGEPISSQQRYIEQLEELSALYGAKIAELQTSLIAIERAISSLTPELASMMRYRYIDGYGWVKINCIMHISKTTSMRWHREALKKISKL